MRLGEPFRSYALASLASTCLVSPCLAQTVHAVPGARVEVFAHVVPSSLRFARKESAQFLGSNIMTATILLALFTPFFQEGFLNSDTPAIQDVLRSLPTDQETYVRIAEEAFASQTANTADPNYLFLEKTIDIFKLLLFLDGRSELGLLKISELAYENPDHAGEATNALAALAMYYRSGGKPAIARDQLTENLERYMGNTDLFHNARECRNALASSGQ